MPRLKPLTLTGDERAKLEAWARRPKTAQRLALRSRIVRAAAAGLSNTEIATDLRVTMPTVGKWRQRFLDDRLEGLADSYLGLIVVHAALGAPFVLTTVLATLAGFNHNLVRASLSLGETPLNTFFRITLPVIAPGVISGALFAFATSFDEVVVTLFLAGADQSTLPRQMFNGIRENISPTIAAVATLLILFTTSLLLALEWLRGRRA